MIDASFIKKIEDLVREADGKLVHVNGIDYATDALWDTRKAPPEFPHVCVSTLTGLVSYVRANPDKLDPVTERAVAHVTGPTKVVLWGEAVQAPQLPSASVTTPPVSRMGLMSRPLYLVAECRPPGCEGDQDCEFMPHDDFMLYIQQAFTDKGDLKHLKKVIGNIVSEDVKQANDDGVTQRVTTKTGAVLVGDATVPNPVKLHPIKTFSEIAPPPMEYILRVRDGRDLPQVGLFPTDAGEAQWNKDCIERIAGFVMEKLADTELGKTTPVIY